MNSSKTANLSSYLASGVSINEGEQFINDLKPMVKTTFSRDVLTGIGNFGAAFQLPAGYRKPVFVASTDGLGTKLKVAEVTGKYDTIGEDLVNHCVNDIAVCGAVPLFFLDYMAFGKLRRPLAVKIAEGMVRACKENGCSLIGGETAEMPDIYSGENFDIAGTIVGIAERAKLVDKKNVKPEDVMIGISSSGLHTNGYSLARKVLLSKYDVNRYFDELRCTLGEELLKVHRSYLRIIQPLLKKFQISSLSHITGGGILGNTRRVVPDDLKIKIDWDSWERNPVFDLIQETGGVHESEMRKVFNLGIGLVLIAGRRSADKIIDFLKSKKEKSFIIGEVTKK